MPYWIRCPACSQEALNPLSENSACGHCGTGFSVRADCPACHAVLERIIGCGTTTFFCGTCKAMVSKREAVYQLSPE